MTKKHYTALAAAIAGIRDHPDRYIVANKIGAVLAEQNGAFSWPLWMLSCRVNTPLAVQQATERAIGE